MHAMPVAHVALRALLLAAAACGPPAPVKQPAGGAAAPAEAAAPAVALPLDRDYARLAEQAVQLHRAIAEAFRTTGEDCVAAAAKLDELRATYAETVAANNRILEEGRDKELRPALAKHSDQLDAAARSIDPVPDAGAVRPGPGVHPRVRRARRRTAERPECRGTRGARGTRGTRGALTAPTSTARPRARAAPARAPRARDPRAPGTAARAGRASSR